MWQPGCEKLIATWFRVVFELFVSTRSKTATSANRTTLAFIHGQGDDGDEHHDDNDHDFTLFSMVVFSFFVKWLCRANFGSLATRANLGTNCGAAKYK